MTVLDSLLEERSDANELDSLGKELAAVMPFVLEVRRDLHCHPEVGGEEQWTREYLEKALQDIGISNDSVLRIPAG